MKLKVSLKSETLILPLHYNHLVQAALLNTIPDEGYKQFMHDEGYYYEKRSYKLFTFSKIRGCYKVLKETKQLKWQGNIELIISSSQKKFIEELAKGIETQGIQLGKNRLRADRLEIIKEEIQTGHLKVKSLSPVVAYSTIQVEDKKRTQYYSPQEEAFSNILRENILKKYKALYGEENLMDDSFEVIPIATEDYKKSVVYYKNFIINGYNGSFVLIGNPRLIQLAIEAGLGGKNAQGFGCIEAI